MSRGESVGLGVRGLEKKVEVIVALWVFVVVIFYIVAQKPV